MSNINLCKGKHLRIEDRLIIEYGVDQNYTLKEITEGIKKDSTNYLQGIQEKQIYKDK